MFDVLCGRVRARPAYQVKTADTFYTEMRYCTVPVYNLGPASSTDTGRGAALTRAAALAASSTDDMAKGSGWIPLPLVPRAALVAASTDDVAKGGGWIPLIPRCHSFSAAKAEVAEAGMAAAAAAAAAAVAAVAAAELVPPKDGVALVEALASAAALAATK